MNQLPEQTLRAAKMSSRATTRQQIATVSLTVILALASLQLCHCGRGHKMAPLVGLKSPVSASALCTGSIKKLNHFSQMSDIIKELQDEPFVCSKYRDAMLDLRPILKDARSRRSCSLKTAKRMLRFQETYAAKDAPEYNSLPDAARIFFANLAIELGGMCKASLVRRLESDSNAVLKLEDWAPIDKLEQANVLPVSAEYEAGEHDLMLLATLLHRGRPNSHTSDTPVPVPMGARKALMALKQSCELKFIPIYKAVLYPVLTLTKANLERLGELPGVTGHLASSKAMRRWFNAVLVCSVVGRVKITDGKDRLELVVGEEAKEVEQAEESSSEEEDKESGPKAALFEPTKAKMTDQLWLRGQQELDRIDEQRKSIVDRASELANQLLEQLAKRVSQQAREQKLDYASVEYEQPYKNLLSGVGIVLAA